MCGGGIEICEILSFSISFSRAFTASFMRSYPSVFLASSVAKVADFFSTSDNLSVRSKTSLFKFSISSDFFSSIGTIG